MICALCHTEVTLLDLDAQGYLGEPAHEHCAAGAREAERAAATMVTDEQDPRRHRRLGQVITLPESAVRDVPARRTA